MVSLLEGGAGQLDILGRAVGSEVSVDRIIDLLAREVPRADDAVFANVKGGRRKVTAQLFSGRVGSRNGHGGVL